MPEFYLLPALFLMAALLTGAIRQIALRLHALDHPDERSSHQVPTPVGGGLAIVVAFLLATVYLLITDRVSIPAFAAVASGAVIAALGLIDDLQHVDYRWRMAGHFAAAFWVVYWLSPMTIALPIYGDAGAVTLPGLVWILVPLGLVWLLNLYNFMDGIDGLAGTQCCFVSAAAIFILAPETDSALVIMAAALFAGSAGFVLWNLPPARIFMGDSGSGFIGFMLGVLALLSFQDGAMTLSSWVLLLGVFIVDSTVTLIRRVMAGAIWYRAHRQHAYQYASRHHGSHGLVTGAIMLINVLWLLPLAWFADRHPEYGVYFTIVGLVPLVLVCLLYGAGTSRVTQLQDYQ